MKDIQEALARVGEHLAEIAQVVVRAIDDLTPEQRAVIEFLAENPKVAEGLQELNQKLAKQRAIGGATKETAQPAEPLIKDEKVRKAVKAWADANDIERVWHEYSSNWLRGNGLMIELENGVVELEQGNYSIAELCGEEAPEPFEPTFIDMDERIREKEEE